MKKISRKLARTSIIIMSSGCVMLLSLNVLNNIWLEISFVAIGSILVIVSLLIKAFVLKCPNCGLGGIVPQWSKSGTIHCVKCGKVLEYDR